VKGRARPAGRSRRTLFALWLAAVLPACVPATPVLAGIGDGNGEIGVDYGRQRIDSDLMGGTGTSWSLRAGVHHTDLLQWEVQVLRSRLDEELLPDVDRKVTLELALVNVVFNFRARRKIVPYGLMGFGIAKTRLEAVGLTTDDTEAGYQIGGGTRVFFGDRSAAALRVEIAILGGDAFEHSYFHPSIAAGLTFRLGRRPPPPGGGAPMAG
jgi:outer membrane protein with beta-barrel domain